MLYHTDYILFLKWAWSQSRDILKFWEISDNNSKTVQSHRPMASNGMIANDLE